MKKLFGRSKDKQTDKVECSSDISATPDTVNSTGNQVKPKESVKTKHKADKPVFNRTCEYCGKLFKAKRPDTMYCKPGCRVMASRKGMNRHKYPNQLERGLEWQVKDYISRLKDYSGSYIDLIQYYKLEHECEVIIGLTTYYVDHENEYFRLLTDVISPIFPKDKQPIMNKEGTQILFRLDNQTYDTLAKYDPCHGLNRVREEL